MTTVYNGQQQLELMRAIALKALMSSGGDNCFCSVQKPTKFIVTLKPVAKVPNTDPFIRLQQKPSSCTCNNENPRKKPTTDQIQMRNNNEAIKGKTLLNAFRVLTNSKFISIDPKYDYGNNAILSPSHEKIRLTGGGWNTSQTKKNHSKALIDQSRSLKQREEKVKQEKNAKEVSSKESLRSAVCQNERIYRILQHSCFEKNSSKTPLKCRIVCLGESKSIENKKEPKKEHKKASKKPLKNREQLKRELESDPEEMALQPPPLIPPVARPPPIRQEKAVGTSDESGTAAQQQITFDVLQRDPLKYFAETCPGVKQTEGEKIEKSPCPLDMVPFPGIRKPETIEKAPPPAAPPELAGQLQPELSHQIAKEERLPCHEKEVHKSHEPVTPRKPPDISNEIIVQQCHRIQNLELQVNELRRELGRMKTEIIPPDDMLRCTALTSKLRELTALLADLKNHHAEAIATVIMPRKQLPQSTECKALTQTPAIPQMKVETVQTYFPADHKDQHSQTNASFGCHPFVDTQSSPPSNASATPKNTSSEPASSHSSSIASSSLPCRHGIGEMQLAESPSFCPHCQRCEHPPCVYVQRNLHDEIMRLLHYHRSCDALLSVLLQPNNLYHINISVIGTGEPLGCIYASEHAINEAVATEVFSRFLTFFIVDAHISVQQKDKILAHTFEFFKN
ncbi:uncharacterized protein LOC128862738 [Anastrepha ludens]|uniref:uncharacterized protein LOC128862738 n=1 Tax=Anastrepha ludens TaxID=28586 RepID=UPI0023AF6F75|nr:uncharacterized protein LOC128862738 [Anastrepha ludens]